MKPGNKEINYCFLYAGPEKSLLFIINHIANG